MQKRHNLADNVIWLEKARKQAESADENLNKTVFVDIETTGISIDTEEILQVSIIDDNGTVLFNHYIKPTHHTAWEEAESINHISPVMVADEKTIYYYRNEISTIINSAELIVGYNHEYFDLPFLAEAGIDINNELSTYDVMQHFSDYRKERCNRYDGYKRFKLLEVCDYFGYDAQNLHNSLADVYATRYCYHKLKELEH